MKLWASVEKTDPRHTKRVNQRGGFTSIDAHYQVQCATKAFGPIGIGWGVEVMEPRIHDSVIIVPVVIWHGDRSNRFGPILGCAEMFGKRVDTDAPKKATTDAITKGLSMLGFNADVFLGRFDDNKYVEKVAAEFTSQDSAGAKEEAIATLKKAQTIEELQSAWKALDRAMQRDDDVIKLKEDKKYAFTEAE